MAQHTDLPALAESYGFAFLGDDDLTTAWACSRQHFGLSLYDAAGNVCPACERREQAQYDRADRASLDASESPAARAAGREI